MLATFRGLGAAAVIVFATAAAPAWAQQINDQAHFFSPTAISAAKAKLSDVKSKYGVSVVVETFSLPEAEADRVKKMSENARNTFWEDYRRTKREALGLGEKTLLILISRNPGRVELSEKEGAEKAVPTSESDKIRRDLLAAMKDKKYDEGIQATAASIATTVASHSKPAPTTSLVTQTKDKASKALEVTKQKGGELAADVKKDVKGMSVGTWVVLGVVFFIGFFLIRALFGGSRSNQPGAGPYAPNAGQGQAQPGYGGRPGIGGAPQPGYGAAQPGYGPPQPGYPAQPGYGGAPGQPAGGGGFMKGVAGGLIGGAAGAYLYDKMGHGGQAQGGTPIPGGGGAGGYGESRETGGGGDFDAGGAAGSTGGDYGGGGDFDAGSGGGDYGGGGDFDAGTDGGDAGGGGDFDAGGDTGGGGGGDDF